MAEPKGAFWVTDKAGSRGACLAQIGLRESWKTSEDGVRGPCFLLIGG